jgi:hypothetical protein
MKIDFGMSENAALYTLQDLVSRGYQLGIKTSTGEEFEFEPTGLDDDEVIVGYKLDKDGNRCESEIEVEIGDIEEVAC